MKLKFTAFRIKRCILLVYMRCSKKKIVSDLTEQLEEISWPLTSIWHYCPLMRSFALINVTTWCAQFFGIIRCSLSSSNNFGILSKYFNNTTLPLRRNFEESTKQFEARSINEKLTERKIHGNHKKRSRRNEIRTITGNG